MQKKILLTTLLFTIALSGCKEKAKDHNHSAANEDTNSTTTAAMDVEPSDQVMDMKQMTEAMDVAEERPINNDMTGPGMPRLTAAVEQMDNNPLVM